MSKRDERLAQKYAAKGAKSATQTAREKEATRGSRSSRSTAPAAGSVEDQLRNFDLKNPQPIERSEESKERARGYRLGLPRLR